MSELTPAAVLKLALERACERDLPDYPGSSRTDPIPIRPDADACDVIMFAQVWNSNALGFARIDLPGQAVVSRAYTVVVRCEPVDTICVYFDGRLAYVVEQEEVAPLSFRAFLTDLDKRNLLDSKRACERYGARVTRHWNQ
jgi:hypothetical protein